VAVLDRNDVMVLATAPGQGSDDLLDDAMTSAVDALLDWAGFPAWSPDGFEAMSRKVDGQVERAALDVLRATAGCLRAAVAASVAVDAMGTAPALRPAVADMRAELSRWLAPGFLTRVGAGHLPDLERYLRAIEVRAGRVRDAPDRDRDRMTEVAGLSSELETAMAALPPERAGDPDVRHVRRLLAEYRIALFAQPMRTAEPVSPKRIRAAIAALAD
jgi:ATP-dependent helicase HrpA